jgi:hypothetical protein
MKRVLLAFVSIVLTVSIWAGTVQASGLSTGVPHVSTASVVAQAQGGQVDPQNVTVYVTRTGTKYHRDGCRYLSKSKIPMSLKEAAKRYEPCKVCRPPVMK